MNTEYSLKLILENYDNSIAFAVGLTGFLVQAKSALDSLSEEIDLRYSLGISNSHARANYDMDLAAKLVSGVDVWLNIRLCGL